MLLVQAAATATSQPDHKIRIIYTSARRLCHVATSIIRGLAANYGEEVTIAETECMHRGANRCVLQVTTTDPS